LDVFPEGTFLEIQLPLAIEHMKMNHRMEQLRSIMTFPTGG
jgi:hypothetical protein